MEVLSTFSRNNEYPPSFLIEPWFKRGRTEIDIDAINYVIKYTTRIKAKFSYYVH